MTKRLIASVLLSLLLPVQAWSADIAAGETKAAMCIGCHGATGNSASGAFPSLAGQHASYLAEQLQDYRDGSRENATMQGMAAGLSDEDIDNLAAFYAAQTLTPKAAGAAHAEGELIYRGGITEAGVASCTGCHGPGGEGNPGAKFPSLAGQYADYTVAQLKAFRSGGRNNDDNKMMRNIAQRMTDDEMQAVADFLQGLQ